MIVFQTIRSSVGLRGVTEGPPITIIMPRAAFFLMVVTIVAMYCHQATGEPKAVGKHLGGIGGIGGCSRNEFWNRCMTCPPTCQNPRPRACAAQCRSGCQCRRGLLRQAGGQCVPRSRCSPLNLY